MNILMLKYDPFEIDPSVLKSELSKEFKDGKERNGYLPENKGM